jgi:hypothetical protein
MVKQELGRRRAVEADQAWEVAQDEMCRVIKQAIGAG